eukprot:13340927-Alexandrium_andersonii.AAC.1
MPPDPARNAEPPDPSHNTSGSSANASGFSAQYGAPMKDSRARGVEPRDPAQRLRSPMPPDSAH